MRAVGLPHRWLGKEISLDRPRIVVRDFGETRIGKYWEIVCTIGRHTLAQCIQELRIAPPANARVRISSDVRGVEGPERSCERAAAGVRTSAVLGVGMTVRATGRSSQVGTVRHQISVF